MSLGKDLSTKMLVRDRPSGRSPRSIAQLGFYTKTVYNARAPDIRIRIERTMALPKRHRSFLSLALPNVAANLVVPLASLIDVAVLGNLDDLSPLAGVALAAIIFDILYLTLNFLRIGTTGLTAIAEGANDKDAISAVFFRSFAMAMVAGLLLIALQGFYREPALGFLVEDESIYASALAYFSARILGAPAALGNFVITGWLLGRHKPKAILLLTLVLSAVNIVGDWLFVWQWGMGARGAGLATMISQYLAFFLGLALVRYFWRDLPGFKIGWLLGGFRPLLQLQANIMVRTFCLTTTFSAFTYISGQMGAVILAANTVLERILYSSAWLIDGYAFALEALSGRFWGAGKESEVRNYFKTAMIWNLGTVFVLVLVFILFGKPLIGLLIADEGASALAISWIPWLCIILCFSGFAYILDGLYIGLAAGRILRQAMLASTLIGFWPLAIWALNAKNPQILWAAMLGFMICRTIALGRNVAKPLLGAPPPIKQ